MVCNYNCGHCFKCVVTQACFWLNGVDAPGAFESPASVDELSGLPLDSEPNRLGFAFRGMLYRQTHGHPLFTVELLRGMQERGDLVRDAEDRWVEGPALDWETLPARVEAAIAERIGNPHQMAEYTNGLAEVARYCGRLDEAERMYREAFEAMRRHISFVLDFFKARR